MKINFLLYPTIFTQTESVALKMSPIGAPAEIPTARERLRRDMCISRRDSISCELLRGFHPHVPPPRYAEASL